MNLSFYRTSGEVIVWRKVKEPVGIGLIRLAFKCSIWNNSYSKKHSEVCHKVVGKISQKE